MSTRVRAREPGSASPYALALREALKHGDAHRLAHAKRGALTLEVVEARDGLWVIVRRDGQGGVAHRAAHIAAGRFECRAAPTKDDDLTFEIRSVQGLHRVSVRFEHAETDLLRVRASLTPSRALRLPFAPRDLYPLDGNDDPITARGVVEAAQRGVNTGLAYFRFEEPAFGSVLYCQNLTTLNPYFRVTGTKPDGVVGGVWPELGYRMPVRKADGADAEPVPSGEETALSDVILAFRDETGADERQSARLFLQLLGAAYRVIEHPKVEYRDWIGRADRTLADLSHAPEAAVRHYGQRYVMPYVNGEVPDAMVQLSLISALHDYGEWRGAPEPLQAELKRGLGKFYDRRIGALRRYLPNIRKRSPDKDPDAVDSWYLYHPMMNLARLALDGDAAARRLLLKSVRYGIESARHFEYRWPILYKIDDRSVITETRGDKRFGETDVNGIYAYLMTQLYQLTSEQTYLDEAKAALDTVKGLRFDLMYQANLTVWGAVACIRLWRITKDRGWLEQSYVYVAGFFHNCEMWESEIGHAVHYSNFLGATCLHDAPYMALYECFESFKGFEEYLADCGPELDPAARMLISEYCRYTLHRAWSYFPDTLPREILHDGKQQSGVLDPKLSFPLEDLYGDGQSPGQIGQEIYGAGAAFVFVSRAFHAVEDAPFRLYCDHFLQSADRIGRRSLSVQLNGGENCKALVSLVRLPRRRLGRLSLRTSGGDVLRPYARSDDRVDFHVPADGRFVLDWQD